MKHALLLASVLLLLVACTNKPVLNIDDAPVVTGTGATPDLAEVRSVIVKAANVKGWTVKEIDPMHLEATLRTRKIMAQVVIAYSTSAYSITYKDSRTLKYNGKTIHRRYNRWIHKLRELINQQLVAL